MTQHYYEYIRRSRGSPPASHSVGYEEYRLVATVHEKTTNCPIWESVGPDDPRVNQVQSCRFNEPSLSTCLTLIHRCWEEVEICWPHLPERSTESRIWTRQSQTHQPVPGPTSISTSSVESEMLTPSPSFAWMHSVLWLALQIDTRECPPFFCTKRSMWSAWRIESCSCSCIAPWGSMGGDFQDKPGGWNVT